MSLITPVFKFVNKSPLLVLVLVVVVVLVLVLLFGGDGAHTETCRFPSILV